MQGTADTCIHKSVLRLKMTKEDYLRKKEQIRETYRYDEMSNKVLKPDKSRNTVRTKPLKDAEESQPRSMNGRIRVKEMGDCAREDTPQSYAAGGQPDGSKKREKSQLTTIKKNASKRHRYAKSSVLDSDLSSTLKYSPTDDENTDVYEEILKWTTDILGNDIPHDIILGTADLLISSLKESEDEADGLIEKKRERLQKELSILISAQKFQALLRLTQRITDYGESKDVHGEKIVAILAGDSEDDALHNSEEDLPLQDPEGDESDSLSAQDEIEFTESLSHKGLPPVLDKNTVIHSGGETDAINRVSILEVDEFFLRRKIIQAMENIESSSVQRISDAIYDLLEDENTDNRALGEKLLEVLDVEHLHLVKYIVSNRVPIIWGIRLSKRPSHEREDLLREMRSQGLETFVNEYKGNNIEDHKRDLEDASPDSKESDGKRRRQDSGLPVPALVDLSALEFEQGANLMTVTKVELPEGSFKKVNKLYEEIHIPPPDKPEATYDLIPISEFPEWARKAFVTGETDTLNVIQSKVFPIAFQEDSNMLICAPTGAGKTNVAVMSILRTISKYFNTSTKTLNLKLFKIVYIAPLKALVQEQVRELQRRLAYLGVKVEELTGDSNLSKQQIAETQILVSTPEKWDIISRKAGESFSYSELVQLIIIDEVHLLHDRRGPVIENIVARSFNSDVYPNPPRLVGLSATLPNYQDVAKFLHVPEQGLFFFNSSFRPCPLSQQFCGITEKNSIKKLNAMNEACFQKTLESTKNGHQVIIFVHSRKETARTSAWLKEKFIESGNVGLIQMNDAGSREILSSEADTAGDMNLKKTIQHGIGIHHAGLSRSDRTLSEDLFADGLLKILVSTATLAWGVNLPAHTVIVKGTDLYSPEKGRWEQLSPQDLLQMLGRAGRPRYDTHGEGIIITNQADVQYYLAVLNQQLSIESQLISMIVDSLNAEVVSGNIKSRVDAVRWLSYTYFYVRALISPELYKVTAQDKDVTLVSFRDSIAHSAFVILQEKSMVVYDANTGLIEPTELGRIAAYFYIKHTSIAMYNTQLTKHTSQIDLFRVISMSEEFQYLSVKQEERKELKELSETSPIPIMEDIDNPLAKVNVLLQSYISRLKFEGFALNADMNFVSQNAGRLIRALYELSLKKKLSNITKILLNMCKMIERRMWNANSPLRQFPKCPKEVIKRMEASTIPWPDYLELESPAEVGQTIRLEKYGKLVFDLLQRFPKIQLKCVVQPITASLLRFELEILPEWTWDPKLHGRMERFIVLVEDAEDGTILFIDSIPVNMENIGEDHIINFGLNLSPAQQKCLPPHFFVNVISERWLNCESQLAVKVESIHLPKKASTPTPLLDIPLTHISELGNEEFASAFDFTHFNKFQSQVFQSVYNSNENCFIAAAKGSGKTTIAELALLNHWRQNKGRAIYISPYQERVDSLLENWHERFSDLAAGKNIEKLGTDVTRNLRVISQSHLILATPEQFNLVSRRWRQRKNLQKLELVIYDDAHEMNRGSFGAVYEALISRMAFITNQTENIQRVIGLSSCLANGRDFAEWLGVQKNNFFNFSPHERISPIEIHIQAFNNVNDVLYDKPMTRLAFEFASRNRKDSAIFFLPTKKSCFRISSLFLDQAAALGWNMLKNEKHDIIPYIEGLQNKSVRKSVMVGIGIIHESMEAEDTRIVERLYDMGVLSILLLTGECCFMSPSSKIVAVLGTQYYDERSHNFVNYPANNILEMVGSAGASTGAFLSEEAAKVLILTSISMKEYYRNFLTGSLPLESYMYFHLHDLFSTEISSSVIQCKQDCIDWLAYTYFYRRLHANPSFYGVKDVSAYGISAYLTELVESTLNDLNDASMIEIEENADGDDEKEESISPLNGCLISSHYDISFVTMHIFLTSLSGSSTLEEILQILSRAAEFEDLSIDEGERAALSKIQHFMPLKASKETVTNLTWNKVFVLLQAYFSRTSIKSDFQMDLRKILRRAVPLINAVVDILSGDGRLNAMTAMDISQMLIQGVWDTDSPLKQVPYFDNEILSACSRMKIETVFDIMALEDAEREQIMTMNSSKLTKVAHFINNYPNIELEYNLEGSDNIEADQAKVLLVTLTRDEAPDTLEVSSLTFPFDKLESWWLVLGKISTRELLAIKKVSIRQESQTSELEFTLPKGEHQLTLWCVCDSYLDADKEVSLNIHAV